MEEIFYFQNNKFVIIDGDIYHCNTLTKGTTVYYQRIKVSKVYRSCLMEVYIAQKFGSISLIN